MNKEQILKRLAEIREMMEDEEKRGDTSFVDLEKEVRSLKEQLAEIEAQERMKEKIEDEEEREETEEEQEERSNFRKVKTSEEEVDEARAFEKYLETRDIETDGLKTDEGYVVVPEDEKTNIIELADDIISLKQYVTVKPVSTPSGTQPVRTTARAKLQTVEELAESPAIGEIGRAHV